MLRLYNTLTQTKEPFQPVTPGKVGMYVCGPTVYSNSHIGHMVGPVIFDTVKRYLVYLGYDVTWVVNITDIDDKLITQAITDGTTVKELAERVTADYLECLRALGVDGIDHMPRATEYIDEILAMTQGLVDKGFAYASGGDVYFDITKAPEYGKLSHRDPEELQAGARIEPTVIKHHPGDFALWKGSKPGEPFWDSPFGPGRPGWHIECSAMSCKLLGEHFDIHGGGLDLVFPHHENEVVQSESFSGKTFATYWMHNGLITRNGKKISKSDPNTIVLMNQLLEKYSADTLRAMYLTSHYRKPIDYGPNTLEELGRGLQLFTNLIARYDRITGESFYAIEAPKRRDHDFEEMPVPPEVWELRARFLEAMDDDFNTGGALGVLYDLARSLNRHADAGKLETKGSPEELQVFKNGAIVLRELTNILGLFREPTAKAAAADNELTGKLLDLLVSLRTQVRKAKNFALSDEIRDRLAELGVTLEDRPDGTGWKID